MKHQVEIYFSFDRSSGRNMLSMILSLSIRIFLGGLICPYKIIIRFSVFQPFLIDEILA